MYSDDIARYQEYWDKHLKEAEDTCRRCGACCGVLDGDPCEHLKKRPDGKYYCDIYVERLGLKKTVQGKEFHCVSLRDILHKDWKGKEGCAYVKKIKGDREDR